MAVEWAPKVRVNLVTVDGAHRDHLFYGDEAGIAEVGKTVPLGRIANPDDIGDACVFLASDLGASGANRALMAAVSPRPTSTSPPCNQAVRI